MEYTSQRHASKEMVDQLVTFEIVFIYILYIGFDGNKEIWIPYSCQDIGA